MKRYKFLYQGKYVYALASTIIEAKAWINKRYPNAKFITIEKVMP